MELGALARRAAPVLAALALIVIAAPPAALAAPEQERDHERGPNFEAPADASAEAQIQYKKAITAFVEARKPQKGQIKRIKAAIKEFEKARDLAPKFAAPRYYMGVMYSWTMEYDRARQALKQAADLNPAFHQAMVKLADVYWALKEFDKALAECDRAIGANAEFAPAYASRGVIRLKSGNAKGALDDFDAAKKKGEAGLEKIAEMATYEVKGYGWKDTFTCETANYKILTPVSQALADEIGKHAELIYKTYTGIFPKIGKEKRKFPVVVFADKEQYQASGGPEGAGGHYNPFLRKLYLFNYETTDDTLLVLYHEGFHQFLHDYIEDAPQWFNEGLGDFFGPSKHVPPKTMQGGLGSMRIRPNPWRLETIQAAIQAGKVRHFADLMLMSREEMYDPEWVGIHYAQAWSIIYFLVRGGAPPGKPAGPHFKILQEYFKALRRGDGWDTAFVAAFGNDDARLQKLMREWMEFTMGLAAEE